MSIHVDKFKILGRPQITKLTPTMKVTPLPTP